MSELTYGWSLEGENYEGEEPSREAAIMEAIACHDLKAGDNVFTCEVHHCRAGDFVDVDSIKEQMGEAAYEVVGELAETYPDLSAEDEEKLRDLLIKFFDEHAPCDFCQAIEVQEHAITDDEIKEIGFYPDAPPPAPAMAPLVPGASEGGKE